MKYIFIKTKIITGLITGGILLSSVSTTFAVTARPLYFDRNVPLINEYKQINTKKQYGLETSLKNIVTSKNITQKQANKIKAVINRDKPIKKSNFEKTKTDTEQIRKIHMHSNKINPFTDLVANGTITQSQADKIIMKQIYLQHAKRVKSAL
ncbi:hypothetical protein [Clostridium psychrophilum]|uniref:hypothetical protein n=1 Tax=Clostridium psychrophilum TaxID=132926 RepID=UPI001C0E6426|nr:hypothetical protein [Clostridium psychrophilum]MBU3182921.1 hypothetical protein [Clostridium psychrophilum]